MLRPLEVLVVAAAGFTFGAVLSLGVVLLFGLD